MIDLRLKALALLLVTLAAGCAGDIGEACDKSGAENECVDEAICTSTATGTFCLKRCTDDLDCAANEQCNGVSGSNIKSCQP